MAVVCSSKTPDGLGFIERIVETIMIMIMFCVHQHEAKKIRNNVEFGMVWCVGVVWT